jgi:transcriptional regulator with XRE-family HTH domain
MAESLGSLLRQKRESLGLTLEEVERHTHIRIRYLKGIESDDLSSIPSVPQARGFIRNYAAFLGISPKEIAAQVGGTEPRQTPPTVVIPKPSPLKPAAAPPPPTSLPRTAPNAATEPVSPFRENPSTGVPTIPRPETYARPRMLADRSTAKEWFRVDRIFGAIIALVVIALLSWGGYSMVVGVLATPAPNSTEPFLALGSATGSPSAATGELTANGLTGPVAGEQTPSGTVELASGGTPSGSPVLPGTVLVETAVPTSFPTPLGGVYTDVRIHIVVLQRAYLMVTVDGKVTFSDRVIPDATFDFIGQKSVTVSNGAGIRVLFNGVDQGAIGRFGEVVTLTYTAKGVITPTPQATLTPTITPTATATYASTSTKKP